MNTPSVLLPVYNAHSNLQQTVAQILEVLELAARFELWVLDDGSTDDTAEVARELAACYPQIRVLRHPVRLGLAEAIQTGLDQTPCEVVLFNERDYSLDPDDLQTLWKLRHVDPGPALYLGALPTAEQEWLAKLSALKLRGAAGPDRGYQLIRRATFEQFRLEHVVEMITRIDRIERGPRPSGSKSSQRPNFLGRFRRMTGRD